jgi:hypothetical protein
MPPPVIDHPVGQDIGVPRIPDQDAALPQTQLLGRGNKDVSGDHLQQLPTNLLPSLPEGLMGVNRNRR